MTTPKKGQFTNMKNQAKGMASQSGFGMVEVLVSLIILLVGLLGLAGLMVQSQRSEMESYQRVQALILLQDIAARIDANRAVATCYVVTTNTANGSPYLGSSGTAGTPACAVGTASQQAQAASDLAQWESLLQGSAETSGGNSIGAMIGAKGCISYGGAATEIIDPKTAAVMPGTGLYTVSIAWQGLGSTFANTTTMCAKDQYGSELQRRVVTLTFRLAELG